MKRITFNTPASNRAASRAKALIHNGWSCAAGLGSKRRSMTGEIEASEIDSVVLQLKALKCTSIKITDHA